MDDHATPTNPPSSNLLRTFREASSGKSHRQPPLSRRETYVLWALAPLIFVTPWLCGSMLWWSNPTNLALALLPVIFALIPLRQRHDEVTASATGKEVFIRILRFPIFWIGLLFLAYITIQALNYNWQFVWTEGKKGFYMEKLPDGSFIPWLPSGMKSPFTLTNPWQSLMMWMVPWLTICALWGSFRRRKAWRIVLWMLASLGPCIAILGIAAQFSSPEKILWIWPVGNASPFGPFAYRGQGATMLCLCIAAALALFLYYQRDEHRQSGIKWFALSLCLIALIGNVMSMSRAGNINVALLILATLFLVALRILWQRDFSTSRILTGSFICLAVLGLSASLIPRSSWDRLEYRWSPLLKEGGDVSTRSRLLVSTTSWEMFKDNPVTGWGAASFRFYFPVYQQHDIRLIHPQLRDGTPFKRYRYFWRYAHSDPIQLLAEYGIVGCSFLLLGIAYWVGLALYRIRLMRAEQWILLFACCVTMAQSSLDIVFFNPVILLAFSLLLAAMGGQASLATHRTSQ